MVDPSAPTSAVSVTAPSPTTKITDAPIIWRYQWNDHLLSVRIARPPDYAFLPGQFARIGLADEAGEKIWRAYSIVSAPHELFLEFFLVVLPEGKFSARVARHALGQPLLLEKPAQGFLTLDRFKDGCDLWLIGTGTGLAPYISMLREPTTWTRFEKIVVALSVREARDLAYIEEIQSLAFGHKRGEAKLHFVTSLTRDSSGARAMSGRLTTLAEAGALERYAGVAFDHDRSRFMLCGNPDMVEAMRTILKARGFAMNRRMTPGHIIVENYW